MLTRSSQQDDQIAPFGFFSVMEIEDVGYCGGYLVLNDIGRPLEFHCTLPVKPERSQQILYGATLRQFLFAEHIGPPLIARAKNRAAMVLVDQPEALELNQRITQPVALITPGKRESAELSIVDADVASGLKTKVAFDLREPFDRIHSAIDEANALTRQGAR